MNYSEKIVAYDNTITPENLERTYNYIVEVPAWHFAHITDPKDREEAPNPSIYCIQNGVIDTRTPQEVQDYAHAISRMHNEALQMWRGVSIKEIRRLNFQITFEGHHGKVHTDAPEKDGCVTVMTFLSPVWFPEWGGDFKYQYDEDTWLSLPYEPGKTILFDSCNKHTGIGAAIGSTYARLTCVGLYTVDKLEV